MIKGAQSNYGVEVDLPRTIGDISKFANFLKCDADQVEIEGQVICRNRKPVKVDKNDVIFFSKSGNYKIEMRTANINNEGQMFLVKANPNGNNFRNEGSAVVGCYSPITGISLIKEYSSKAFDRGEKNFITCGSKTNIARGPPIKGCTNPAADNYNPDATVDDGSCIIKGCTNPAADNYNPEANVDDGSCIIKGCTNPAADNYNPDATVDDGSCIIKGCTNPAAENYNPDATVDNGSCIIKGCTNPAAENYNPDATVDDGSCIFIPYKPEPPEDNNPDSKTPLENNESQLEENILEIKEDSSLLNRENTGSKINSSKQKINENKDNQVIQESSKIKNKANNIENIESLIPPWIR